VFDPHFNNFSYVIANNYSYFFNFCISYSGDLHAYIIIFLADEHKLSMSSIFSNL
jgi:hypothetical protein